MSWERKPKILLLTDVPNWAWAIKSNQIKKYLSDEFDIEIVHLLGVGSRGFNVENFDLYLVYGWSYCNRLNGVRPINRKISGVTAHKEKDFFRRNIVPALKTTQWHHANSILLKHELEEAGFENVFYVPNGVDEELFHEINPIPESRSNLIVGHVGKNCGQGTDAKGHTEFIEPSCKQAEVVYKGHYNNYKTQIPHSQMVDFYQGTDLFIVASKTDGTPNGALEAAACGRPILSNKIGNMPEFIVDGHNGFLIDRDVTQYIEKLLWFKEHREEMREMGKNARKTIEEAWTWKVCSENYRNMFKTILNQIGLRK